jgi:hypothetical protein
VRQDEVGIYHTRLDLVEAVQAAICISILACETNHRPRTILDSLTGNERGI